MTGVLRFYVKCIIVEPHGDYYMEVVKFIILLIL